MSIIFNIGLATTRTTPGGNVVNSIIPFTEVLRALPTWHIRDLRLIESHSEPTLVVELDEAHTWVLELANRLAVKFDQDCVAIYNRATNSGVLIGPRAHLWGEFNPNLFFTCDGRTLAAAQ